MTKRKTISNTLVLISTIFVWFPLLAPLFLTSILFISEGLFRFDFLMPAELYLFSFVGGILLILTSKGNPYRKKIIKSFFVALIALIGSQVIAVVTGLANGDIEPGGWQLFLVIGVYSIFLVFQVVLGITGFSYYKSIRSAKFS